MKRRTSLAHLSLVLSGLALLSLPQRSQAQQPEAPVVHKPEGIPTPQPVRNPATQFPPLRAGGPAAAQPVEAAPTPAPAAAVAPPAEVAVPPAAQPTPEPVHAEPAHAEPVHAEPAHAEPVHAEPVHAAPAGNDHAAPAHGEASHGEHGSAHGGAHEAGPVIENWWSWDYTGPNRSHHHPPFGFALINFAVFLFILNKLAGKSWKEFLANRHLEVRKALDRARELEQKAQEQLAEYEKKGQAMQAEIDTLLTSMKAQAQVERQRIIAHAESEAAKLLKDAEAQVQQTIEGAKRDLERKTALLAVELAEKLVTSRINELDQRNLVERFVTQVESAASQPPTGGRS